ncbi:unnamed protein product [Schistosoma curassoni]|uniref:Reverse transcriptase domain-containing protein n=1 Tax=Schistosoma curassoni TaxID=6186 RepID=A0A183KYD7_9TREM|nr:unnamed protein product [Schistosoma curassoni]
MEYPVDAQLRDQQTGLRKDRTCTDEVATPRIIAEQPIEWSLSPYINLTEYEKAFDSVDMRILWRHPRYYGVPEKTVKIIRN